MTNRLAVTSLALALAGAACSSHPAPPPAWAALFQELPAPLLSAWEAPTGELYAVGGNAGRSLVLRHDSNGWWEMDPGTSAALWWVTGRSASDVYAVGERGVVSHFDGQRWQVLREGPEEVFWGAAVSGADMVLVGGHLALSLSGPRAVVLRERRFLSVDVSALPSRANLFKVAATPDGVVVVGDEGVAARLSADALVPENTGSAERLFTVFSGAPGTFAVGGLGRALLLQRTEGGWSERRWLGERAPALSGGAVGTSGELAVVGERGFIAQGREGALVEQAAVTSNGLHAVTRAGQGYVAVGGELELSLGKGVLLARDGPPAGPLRAWPERGVPFAPDAGPSDGGPPDAGPPDAGLPAGSPCLDNYSACAAPLRCYLWMPDGGFPPKEAYCTHACANAAACEGEFGPGACCLKPGPQTFELVCGPKGALNCN